MMLPIPMRIAVPLVIAAALLAGIAVQSYRLRVAVKDLEAETLRAQSLSVQLQTLQERNKALESALVAREEDRRQLQKQYEALRKRLKDATESSPEARDWSARPIPDSVLKCLRDPNACDPGAVPSAATAPSS